MPVTDLAQSEKFLQPEMSKLVPYVMEVLLLSTCIIEVRVFHILTSKYSMLFQSFKKLHLIIVVMIIMTTMIIIIVIMIVIMK